MKKRNRIFLFIMLGAILLDLGFSFYQMNRDRKAILAVANGTLKDEICVGVDRVECAIKALEAGGDQKTSFAALLLLTTALTGKGIERSPARKSELLKSFYGATADYFRSGLEQRYPGRFGLSFPILANSLKKTDLKLVGTFLKKLQEKAQEEPLLAERAKMLKLAFHRVQGTMFKLAP